MHSDIFARCAALAAPFAIIAGLAAPAHALTAPAAVHRSDAVAHSAIVQVHARAGRHTHHRHAKHRHHHDHVVDAPFTRVRSGRRVEVDAPFTSVTVTRRGRHVRAPFVDLWVPRGR